MKNYQNILPPLADLEGMTEKAIKEDLVSNYTAKPEQLETLKVLVAYQDDNGMEAASFFLFQDQHTGELLENHADACSCYGFQGQFKPEATTLEYLKSDKFSFSCYKKSDRNTVKVYINAL